MWGVPLLAALTAAAATSSSDSRPNLLFIITDDQDLELGSMAVLPTVQREIFDAGMVGSNSILKWLNHHHACLRCHGCLHCCRGLEP
jgi:hypothetical protein